MRIKHERKKLNVRLHPEIRQGTLELAENCQITRDDLVETVFAALFGSKDEVVQAKWGEVQVRGHHVTVCGRILGPPE